MDFITPPFEEDNPGITVDLQAIGYGDLRDKMLPAIAAGEEGDVMMLYTDWMVATDLRQVFLDITEPAGGLAVWQEKMYAASFEIVDAPEGKVFYLPWLAGIRGACTSVNLAMIAEQDIDYNGWQTWEDVVDAGVALTQRNDEGKITRAGLSVSPYQLLWSFIYQMGGDMYDRETGTWMHATDEGEAAAQLVYNVYWGDTQTRDFELFDSEWDAINQNMIGIWTEGAFTMSILRDVSGIESDIMPTPMLADRVEDVLYPQHAACWGLSKRLVDAGDKLEGALDYALNIVSTDALLVAMDFYSGTMLSREVYADPRIGDAAYGLPSKRVAEGVWPIARLPRDHVAVHDPASEELMRALRQEVSIPEALTAMDEYLQVQEDEARERIGEY